MKRLTLFLLIGVSLVELHAQNTIEFEGIKGTSYTLETSWGNLHYEIYGKGEPLLILHGNGGSAKGKRHLVPALIDHFQVITMDSRCHGQSDCPDGDLDYFEMADDVARLMDELGHDNFTIWGHSDGGILGLILGYTQTERISKMLISGANTRLNGLEPALVKMMSVYEQLEDPIMKKHLKLMVTQKEIPMDSLRKVNIPVMLMVGDRDAVRMEHTLEIFNALPMANLCVLPASSHFIENEKPNHIVYWLKEMKKPFTAPSTIEIAEQMAKSMFDSN